MPQTHASNNRLSNRPSSKFASISPGMRTRLDIDYGDICTSFDDIINENKLSSTTNAGDKVESSLTKAGCNEKKCAVSTYRNDSNVKKVEDGTTIELLDSSSDDESLSKMEKMHDRMVKRARRNISQSIENRLLNDSENEKKNTKKWKQTVSNLLKSKETGSHLDIIKDVTTTDTGSLLETENPPSSQDMLNRVSVYYDTD